MVEQKYFEKLKKPKIESDFFFISNFSEKLLKKIYFLTSIIIDEIYLDTNFLNDEAVSIHKDKIINSSSSLTILDVTSILSKLADSDFYALSDFTYRDNRFYIDFGEAVKTHILNLKTINKLALDIMNNAPINTLAIRQNSIVFGVNEYLPHSGSIQALILQHLKVGVKDLKTAGKYNFKVDLNWLKNNIDSNTELKVIKAGIYSINKSLNKNNIKCLKFRIRKNTVLVKEY